MNIIATATEVKNNFGKYMEHILAGDEVLITKNGKEIGRIVPKGVVSQTLTQSLAGIVAEDVDYEEEKMKALRSKYELAD